MHEIPSHKSSNGVIDILLIEDNPGDVRLTQEAFKTIDQKVTLQTIASGDNAVEFLQQSPETSLPDLVLLDLNLPGRDGCWVLEAIRDDPQLKPLPVIMLTSSETDEDIERCYGARANAYLTKPTAPDEYTSLVDSLERFWFEQVQFPPTPH
ncbi:response regulator [Natrinema soli]|uniref:Response regulator n=1 Tax=Natrinema soli TaxID=1930624 RepID=A0ABD5SNX9_9EURY|nr:response regulator [Natrinema soli]